jgi:hypothetical protein
VGLVLLLTSNGVASAGLVDDARNLLSRLNDVGDLGRGAAETAVRQAREAAERSARDANNAAVRRLDEAGKTLAELERQRKGLRDAAQALRDKDPKRLGAETRKLEQKQLDAKADKLKQDNAKIDAMVKEARERYDQAMAAATTELVTGIASALVTVAGGAVNTTVGDVQRRVDDARNRLRAVIPQPVGTRPPTRTERRCATVLGREACTDVQVPNGASDGDLHAAIDAARAATDTVNQTGQTALLHFQQAQQNQADLQAAQQRFNQFLTLVANAVKRAHEAQMAAINNLKG